MNRVLPFSPTTPTGTGAQVGIETLRVVSILLRDILFELGEFKSRHDDDLHQLKRTVCQREAESGRLADAMHLLRDLQATLSTPLTPVAGGVASSNGDFMAETDGCAKGPSPGFTNGEGI